MKLRHGGALALVATIGAVANGTARAAAARFARAVVTLSRAGEHGSQAR